MTMMATVFAWCPLSGSSGLSTLRVNKLTTKNRQLKIEAKVGVAVTKSTKTRVVVMEN